MLNFSKYVEQVGGALLKEDAQCLQMNIGYRCNLTCSHCHVGASPKRTEIMSWPVMEEVLNFAKQGKVDTIDITGGAPEMNLHLPTLLMKIRQIPSIKRILLRTNLAILDEVGYEKFPELFAKYHVEIVASMPCYLAENVDAQRGTGVHPRNIRVLQTLNTLGYGKGESLKLHLVYNPLGDFLPGGQAELEQAYKKQLQSSFGIVFDTLYTITNMPIGRFRVQLEKQGLLNSYEQLLVDHFNPDNLKKVMCRGLISVNWQGQVYDCDFNQILKLTGETGERYIGQVNPQELVGQPIAIANHCFACVAGAGSSCQGSLKQEAL